jgi:SAM-dependent methyltransferase
MRLVPKNRQSVLDIGARDGHFSKLLAQYFPRVVALDLEKPAFRHPGVETVAGDATRLQFPDNAFDCVFCAEVLEHIPALEQACREIARVARHEIIIGVPYRQNTDLDRTTCRNCGKTCPPWGHVNSFDEFKIRRLFPGCTLREQSLVGTTRSATNPVSVKLMDLAGNPWGTYNQEEPCIHCGAKLVKPGRRPFVSRLFSGVAVRLNAMQTRFTAPHGNWMHVVFEKDAGAGRSTFSPNGSSTAADR